MLSFFVFLSSILNIIWSLILVPFTLIGYRLYHITSNYLVLQIISKLPDRSTIHSDSGMRGWIFGLRYCGYISESAGSGQSGGKNVEIYLFTTKKFYDSLIIKSNNSDSDSDKEDEEDCMDIYHREGNCYWIEYIKQMTNVRKFKPTIEQARIMDDIINIYNRNKKVVSFIYGGSGSGKSTLPILIAQKLKASFCHSFNPCDPSDTISKLYTSANPTEKKPLVVVLEEVDILLGKCHTKSILPHKYSFISVYDKTTWNGFFDWINLTYPNMILIMTSNVSIDVINEWDPSYMRKGRVDHYAQMNKPYQEDYSNSDMV